VSIGLAGLGLAGQDGFGHVVLGVTLKAIGPLSGAFPLNCPLGRRGRHRPAHLGDLIRRLSDPVGRDPPQMCPEVTSSRTGTGRLATAMMSVSRKERRSPWPSSR